LARDAAWIRRPANLLTPVQDAVQSSAMSERTPWYSQLWFAGLILAVFLAGLISFLIHQLRPVVDLPRTAATTDFLIHSEPYQRTVKLATQDTRVLEILGSPVKVGEVKHGILRTEGAFGWASISIPLSGPRGNATAHVVAQRSAGPWEYKLLNVEFENGFRNVDFLNNPQR
jgi:hypothetical protein